MTDRVAIRGESWQGYLANPSPRRSMGKIRVGFEFHLTDPVAGQIYVDYTIGEVKPFIEATKQIAMAKDLCKHHGVKSQGIRLRLLPESVERVEVAVAEIAAAYLAEQDRIEVTSWHWALGGDSHRVLIFPDQEKNTEEIDQIRDVAR